MHLSVGRRERCRGLISDRRDGTTHTHTYRCDRDDPLCMKTNLIWWIAASVLFPRLRPCAVSLVPRATFRRPRNEMQMMEVPLQQLRVLLEILQSVCVMGGAVLAMISVF